MRLRGQMFAHYTCSTKWKCRAHTIAEQRIIWICIRCATNMQTVCLIESWNWTRISDALLLTRFPTTFSFYIQHHEETYENWLKKSQRLLKLCKPFHCRKNSSSSSRKSISINYLALSTTLNFQKQCLTIAFHFFSLFFYLFEMNKCELIVFRFCLTSKHLCIWISESSAITTHFVWTRQ